MSVVSRFDRLVFSDRMGAPTLAPSRDVGLSAFGSFWGGEGREQLGRIPSFAGQPSGRVGSTQPHFVDSYVEKRQLAG
jgi:hypothetical protein